MLPTIDLTGSRFGRLVTLRYVGGRRMSWACACDCGKNSHVPGANLRKGKTSSCGCLKAQKLAAGLHTLHGIYGTRAAKSWMAMIQRCTNPNDTSYARYGGAGITVCDRWRSLATFVADMGQPPEGMTLDRWPDQKGNYEPDNCRWATPRQQAENRSTTNIIVFRGREYTTRQLSEETGVPYERLRRRLFRDGMDIERAVAEPGNMCFKKDPQ